MTDVNCQWCLSNPNVEKLLLWLEPWAEEFEVPYRSTISLSMQEGAEDDNLGQAEWTDEHLVFWASRAGTLRVYVDGTLQDTASAIVPNPNGLTKEMLTVVFAGQPAARLGGKILQASGQGSWWQRTRSRIGL